MHRQTEYLPKSVSNRRRSYLVRIDCVWVRLIVNEDTRSIMRYSGWSRKENQISGYSDTRSYWDWSCVAINACDSEKSWSEVDGAEKSETVRSRLSALHIRLRVPWKCRSYSVMLGPRRLIEHACQLGWVPVPTQQPKYPQAYILKVFKSFCRYKLHIEAFFLDFFMLHD